MKVVQALTLHNQARYPIAVVAIIHQPSARLFHLFHHVYVIGNTGQCIYEGVPHQIITKLEAIDIECPAFYNPADFIVEIAAGELGQDVIERLADKKLCESEEFPTTSAEEISRTSLANMSR